MKAVLTWGKVFAAGLLSSFQAIAQQPPMQVPAAPQAIGMHLQQQRTLQQREAIEAKKGQPTAAAKPNASAATGAPTATECEARAVGKNGKPLRGAARTSFLKECDGDAKSLRTQNPVEKQKP